MTTYTGHQRFLLRDAQKYTDLGYTVGFCKGKEFLGPYQQDEVVQTIFGPVATKSQQLPEDFDGISLIPQGMVCVDIDINDFSMIHEGLPPTLKEKTPRGWHLFYAIHDDRKASAKLKWREHVDLLVKDNRPVKKKPSRYGIKDDGSPWGEHVLISPTVGYKRIWPDEVPHFNKLPDAPLWLLDVLER